MKTEYINDNNISLINSLTDALKNANIGISERAEIENMRKGYIEKFIEENHNHKISTYNSKGYTTYTTRVDGQKNKIQAQTKEKLYEKLYDYYTGNNIKVNATFESIFPKALDWHTTVNSNSEKTRIRAEKLYNARIKGSDFEKMSLKDVKVNDVKSFLRSFSNTVKDKELSNIKTLLNLTFRYACEELNIIPYNVAESCSKSGIKTLPEKKVGELAYSDEEAQRIVSYLIDSPNVYHEAICLCFYLGLRFSEISDLKKADIKDGVVFITHANTESGNIKNGSIGVRKIPLCNEAIYLLDKIMKNHPETEWLFPNGAGNKIFNNRYNEYLHSVCNELGIEYRSNHKIRAHFITTIAKTSGIATASKLAGHGSTNMTERYVNRGITEEDLLASKSLNLGIQTDSDQFRPNNEIIKSP